MPVKIDSGSEKQKPNIKTPPFFSLNFNSTVQGLLPAHSALRNIGVTQWGVVSTGFQCGSSMGCSSRQDYSTLVWIFHAPQFFWEISSCSAVITGDHVKHAAGKDDGPF